MKTIYKCDFCNQFLTYVENGPDENDEYMQICINCAHLYLTDHDPKNDQYEVEVITHKKMLAYNYNKTEFYDKFSDEDFIIKIENETAYFEYE